VIKLNFTGKIETGKTALSLFQPYLPVLILKIGFKKAAIFNPKHFPVLAVWKSPDNKGGRIIVHG
jgi:hypothetical protein